MAVFSESSSWRWQVSKTSSNRRLAAFLAAITVTGVLTAAPPCKAQTLESGFAFLVGAQQTDGSWASEEVRALQATTEALRALQAANREPASRLAAASFLSSEPVADNDDLARRLGVLAAEGYDIAASQEQLLAGAASEGGWGLTSAFMPGPLDTALVVQALAGMLAPEDERLSRGLALLRAVQNEDGGFSCVTSADAESDIFCTSHALQALVLLRSTTYVEPEIDAAAGFLHDRLNPDGSFGAAGPDEAVHTALASLALAAVPALGSEVTTVISSLEGRQQPDGSWQTDAYTTALALRALLTLESVSFCGDGMINNPWEACDGLAGTEVTCEVLGLGSGTVTCSLQCTLDTSGCSEPPSCGDNLRNQPFEVCDGTDLAARTCESMGFPSGTLACATDCLSFDTGNCNGEVICGDGVVNQPGELCDFNDLNGLTCEELGLGSGLLRCAPDCNLDSSLCDAAGFDIDNKGREFVVGFMPNAGYWANAALYLTSDVPTEVTVEHPVVNPTFVVTVSVNPGKVTIVNLPKSVHYNWWRGLVLNKAVRASAPDEFAAFLVNREQASTDVAMALPVDALGTSYILTTYYHKSQFLIIAPFDNTTVTITPTVPVLLWGTTAPAGVPFNVNLNRGEGFRAQGASGIDDLTGTLITSTRPLSVLNANDCAAVPAGVPFCDHLFESAHPLRSWGTSALVTNLPDRPAGSLYRIVASKDGTVVTLDGISQAILDRGDYLETGPMPGNHVIAANHPIFVTQFMTGSYSPGASLGDPAMGNMIPPEQFQEKYTFSTVNVGTSYGNQNFVTVTAPDASLGAILLDGSPIDPGAFSPVPGSGFSSAVLPIGEGSHSTSSPEPHGITVEGFYFVSGYLYSGGSRLEFTNYFCGDGRVNLENEECDISDFQGTNCTTYGFSAGFLQCTADCRTDTSQCSGMSAGDKDGDGFPVGKDCNDLDPEVNPGMAEFLGNGVDDDCNPATPDEIPTNALSCTLVSDQIAYLVTDYVALEGAVENGDASFSLTGLSTSLVVRDGSGTSIFEEARQLAPLPPGARLQQNFAFTAFGHPPGGYVAELTVAAAGESMVSCSSTFAIESSAVTGAGLIGTLTLDPELVDAGEPSEATYSVENQGNADLPNLALRVLLLDPDTGEILEELLDSTSLSSGDSFHATQAISTVGLANSKAFLAVLLATPASTEVGLTLDTATLSVDNAPPDCSGAWVSLSNLWPPNHKLVEIEIGGVTDSDDDPVIITVTGVLQDERTDDLGSGDTCPDAIGINTPRASLRAERSARQDGRVYHVFFVADDGRGGTCEGELTVCVPHDRQRACVDQEPLHDSAVCP